MVRLKPNEEYFLDVGSWTVGGDATCYSGGSTFYVGTESEYIFEHDNLRLNENAARWSAKAVAQYFISR